MFKHKIKVQGIIYLEVLKNGKVDRTLGPFTNTITNTGMAQILGGASAYNSDGFSFFQRCKVGSGTQDILETDVNLPGFMASSTLDTGGLTQTAQTATLPYFTETFGLFTFALGSVVGTIANIGLGEGNASNQSIFAATRIKDSNGVPTTITLTAEEQLRATYRIRHYAPAVHSGTGILTINGIDYPYNWNYNNYKATSFNAGILTRIQVMSAPNYAGKTNTNILATPGTGTGSTASTIKELSLLPYTPGTNSRGGSVVFGATEANAVNGLDLIRFQYLRGTPNTNRTELQLDYWFPTPIPKTNLDRFTIAVEFHIDRWSE